MKKMMRFTGILCAAALTAALGITSFGKNEIRAAATGLEPVLFDGTAAGLEDGRLTLENVRSALGEKREDMIVTISEHTKVLDAVNGYPMLPEEIRTGEAVRVYVGPAMTMSLPPISNGVMVLAGAPADAAFPVLGEVASCEKGEKDALVLTLADGGQYLLDAQTALLPYLTRNIVTAADLTEGTRVLVWPEGTADAAGRIRAAKVVLFAEENESAEEPAKNGWQEVAGEGWYYYEQGELKTGWLLDNGDWYYLDPETGKMRTGFVTVDGKTYYLEESGRMLTKARTFTPDESGALH